MDFELLSAITSAENIAVGRGIRELRRLLRVYGGKNWRKRKGIASVKLRDGTICRAEVHWYEGHGIGKQEMKIKHILQYGL
ncbi:MAG: hypothetical protein HY721_01780 [Planctomycetes bacterium]|nr:hypothetical protein [Planctomycetota bacterium]